MDFISLIKQLEALGMIGLSLAVAGGLAYIIILREKDGMTQLKGAIEALTQAIQSSQKTNEQTFAYLESRSNEMHVLSSDLKEVKADVALMKQAFVQVGVKQFTEK